MLNRILFQAGYSLKNREFSACYKFVKKHEFSSREQLETYQMKKLRELILFSYQNVPYYHRLFNSLGLKPDDIRTHADLQKIPILTKEIVNAQPDDFIPANLKSQSYVWGSTGGTTGHPLRYRMSRQDEILGLAMMYSNWGYAGYEPGDRIVVIAGSSLIPTSGSELSNRIKALVLNEKRFSSFDLSSSYMDQIIGELQRFKPNYLRGYASAIHLLADYIKNNDLKIELSLKGVFTTAEVLFDRFRETIGEVFNCPVFNQYGLNDGGVSAYECEMHNGLHIDMLRSILEVVGEDGQGAAPGKEGRILATSLHNYAMPFIRYDSGDLGISSGDDYCGCGRNHYLLKEVLGRSVDFLKTPEGKNVHGWFFLYIFWKYCEGIREYQVIQKDLDSILIKIVAEEDFDAGLLKKIEDIVRKKSEGWNLAFEFVDKIDRTKSGKLKFIINEMNN